MFTCNATTPKSIQPSSGGHHHGNGLSAEAKEILFTIQYVLLPLFLVTGLAGNLLTVATMMSKKFSKMMSRYFLICLALSDSVFLLTQPFNKLWMVNLFGLDIRALSNASCKMFYVMYRSSKMSSSWLLVFLCFERFLAIVFPHKMKTIVTKRNTFFAIGVNYIMMFTYNSIWSMYTEVTNGICKPNVPTVGHQIFVVFGIVLYSILPIVLLAIFTPLIIFRLRRQIATRRAMYSDNNSGGSSRANDDMIRVSHMVLCVMLAYIVLVLPITVVQVVGQLIAQAQGVSARDVRGRGFAIFKEIAHTMEQINYAVNFFFYILSSSVFRKRVLEITGFNKCWSKP